MSQEGSQRIDQLERRVTALAARVTELEGRAVSPKPTVPAAGASGPARTPYTPPSRPAAAPGPPPPLAAPPGPPSGLTHGTPPSPAAPAGSSAAPQTTAGRPALSLEDLLGTRVLAWAGGIAVLLGVAFFVAVAIGRGWIDEPTRILLAFVGSTLLLAAGVWLHDRHGQTQASLVLVGTAIACLFTTLTAAVQLYELIPVGLALLVAAAAGITAAAAAVHLDSRAVAGVGIVGSLLAPVLVDAGTSSGSLAFVAVALVAAVGLLLWRRWDWLAVTSFLVSAPQLVAWAADTDSAAALVAVLGAYAALNLAAALGYEVRVRGARLHVSSALLVLASALLVTVVGYFGVVELADSTRAGDAVIAGLATVHFALGVAAVRTRRVTPSAGALLLVVGVALADLAFGLAAGGAGLALGWALAAVALAWFVRRTEGGRVLLLTGVAAHIVLPAGHALLFDAPLDAVLGGFEDRPAAVVALLALGAAAFASARLVEAAEATMARSLDVVAVASLAYLTAAVLDGAPLVAAWAVEGLACTILYRRTARAEATAAAGSLLGLAAIHVLVVEAPLESLVRGAPEPLPAFGALLVLAAACAAGAAMLGGPGRRALEYGTAVTLVYLGSIAIVTGFEPGAITADSGLGLLDERQRSQVLLSGFWSLTGLAAVTAGLLRDIRRLRFGGLSLLALALVKVLAYDLSALDSMYRVLSLVALGLLLLGGAFAYQRLRPGNAPGSSPPAPTTS